jgi:hypothetical protein
LTFTVWFVLMFVIPPDGCSFNPNNPSMLLCAFNLSRTLARLFASTDS